MFAKCSNDQSQDRRGHARAWRHALLQHPGVFENAQARTSASCASPNSAAGACQRRDSMKCLYVLFDADCELCARCRNWLAQQPAFVPLVFIAFQSDEAQRRFPGIDALKPASNCWWFG